VLQRLVVVLARRHWRARACPAPARPCHVIIADRRVVDGLRGRGQCRRPVQRRRSPPGLCIEV